MEQVSFPSAGAVVPALLWRPGSDAPAPGLVIVHGDDGLDDLARKAAAAIAAEGFAVVAPDLQARVAHLTDPQERRRSLADLLAIDDLTAAQRFLQAQPGVIAQRVGALGFSLGGRHAYLLAAHRADLGLCVALSGRPEHADTLGRQYLSPVDLAPRISCPVLGLYGGADAEIPLAEVERFRDTLSRARVPFEIKIYPGVGHRFYDPRVPEEFDAAAAQDAWERVTRFCFMFLMGRRP
ncbi:MAG: dienelactone hydrolase family protein [Armatimonadetes bacterium]|nr:dienelactone hydrolase family protein [Armatimonadota bacterium]